MIVLSTFLLAASTAALVAATAQAQVIGPEMEPVVAALVGKGQGPLDGCTLASVRIERDHIVVKCACAGVEHTIELLHLDRAPAGGVRTAKFALAAPATATVPVPPTLLEALRVRVAAGEGPFAWTGSRSATAEPIFPQAPSRPGEIRARTPAEAELAAEYERGFKMFVERRHPEALTHFLAMAKRAPEYSGVLGMVVANLAPTQPTSARVQELVAAAAAAPTDPLLQFVAGVAAHYSGHYRAPTREEKVRLYKIALEHLERARPAYDFEPRLFIYLAISSYRLGKQADAELFIDKAINLDHQDADAFYCRAEVLQFKSPKQAITDIDQYLELTKDTASTISASKKRRVQQMRAHLEARIRGAAAPQELWDPVHVDRSTGANMVEWIRDPKRFGTLVAGLGASLGAILIGVLVFRARKRRGTPTE